MTTKKYIWDEIFIELSLRAIRKLHLDYGIWGLGQSDIVPLKERLSSVNQGPGIELALETTVGAAIAQEFINSSFTNGVLFDGENRRYQIDREVSFKSSTDNFSNAKKIKRVDLVTIRFDYDEHGKTKYWDGLALIELKRADKFTPDITTGERGSRTMQTDKIIADLNDIEKIKNLNTKGEITTKLKYFDKSKEVRLYSLFWGVYKSEKTHPDKAIEEITKGHSGVNKIKWFPLKWTDDNKVTDWLWVCLFEKK